jgi:hypothetical protein
MLENYSNTVEHSLNQTSKYIERLVEIFYLEISQPCTTQQVHWAGLDRDIQPENISAQRLDLTLPVHQAHTD